MDGLVVRVQEYLEVVGVAVGDLHLDRDERVELLAIAEHLGLSRVQVVQAHRRFVNHLVDAAIDDDVVTDDEYDALIRVAAALDVDQDMVEHRIASFRRSEAETRLRAGMPAVFTGNHPARTRDELEANPGDQRRRLPHGADRRCDRRVGVGGGAEGRDVPGLSRDLDGAGHLGFSHVEAVRRVLDDRPRGSNTDGATTDSQRR